MSISPTDIDAIKRIVIDTFSATCPDPSAVTVDTEVLQLVDSIGLVIALAEVQDALAIELEPHEIIEVFHCRTLGDVASALHASRMARQA